MTAGRILLLNDAPPFSQEKLAMPVNAQDMTLVHRVFRRELGELPGLIDGVAPMTPRARRLSATT